MKKVSIVGWYYMNNVGDDAFQAVLPQFFPNCQIEFIRPPQKCNDPDIVILGGGAVVSPYYLEYLPSCPRYAIGVDIAYKSEIDLLAKYQFQRVLVRNGTDVNEMQKKLNCPVQGIPDLAFLLKPSGNCILKKYKKHPNKKTLGVLVTDYVNPAIDRPIDKFAQRAFDFILQMSKELDVLEKEYEILLIPCSTGGYGDDRRINLDLSAFMKSRPTIIFDTLSPQDMIDLIVELDASICQRFHAHIFSIIAGTPFISIDFTRKVKLLLEENELTHLSAARFDENNKFDSSQLKEKLESAIKKADTNNLKSLASANYVSLLDVMQKGQKDWLKLSA